MNQLYTAKDGPQIPPVPTLPPIPKPQDDYIQFKRSTLLIIIILIGLLMFGIQFYSDYKNAKPDAPTNLKVYCQPTPEGPTIKNNIQGAHAYQGMIVSKDTPITTNNPSPFYCIHADDYGSLWGSSMQPTFYEGNTILLKNYTINQTQLKTGDLIRFYRFNTKYPNCTSLRDAIDTGTYSTGGAWINNSMAVIHRINAIYDTNVVAQGDNLYEQEAIQTCQITGVAVGIIFT